MWIVVSKMPSGMDYGVWIFIYNRRGTGSAGKILWTLDEFLNVLYHAWYVYNYLFLYFYF